MKKFRKKPVVIEAIQFTKDNIKEVYQVIHGELPDTSLFIASDKWNEYERMVVEYGFNIPTLEDGKDNRAKHVASIGDWIIKGIQGELYPCKPDIFKATYDFIE